MKFGALPPLVEKMLAFAQGALARGAILRSRRRPTRRRPRKARAEAPAGAVQSFESLAEVDAALASALGYFQAKEPSSPALLLIVQARATLGKNLYEVIRLLAPRHAENARVFVGPERRLLDSGAALEDAPALDFSPGEAPPARNARRKLSR